MTEANSQAIYIFTIVTFVVIALVFCFIVYFVLSYRHKQRDFLLLESQKAKIDEQNKVIEKTLINLKNTQSQLIQSEKLASLGELTAGIAHEIQNPLNFVNNFSEVNVDLLKELNEEINNPETKLENLKEIVIDLVQNQEKISSHGMRASNIVKSMLEHSRQSTGIKIATDINQLADEYLRLSYHGLHAKNKNFNVNFTTNFDANLPKVEIINQDIGRVILNLINNAFYACNERQKIVDDNSFKPLVEVGTKKDGNFVFIKVKDNGNGMSETTKSKIFQPFFTTKPSGQGTGLGLSLAYDIVTKGHGGTIDVESVEGEGSEFIVTLPIV
jgi:two-component system, NtrC family, sensor kinase